MVLLIEERPENYLWLGLFFRRAWSLWVMGGVCGAVFGGGGWMECRGVLLVVGLLYQRLTIGRCGMGRYLDS